MGTRSLTIVRNGFEDKAPRIVTIYSQNDGYPEGVGKELCDFLSKIKIVNGMRGFEANIANGVGCLAAQLVAHLKTEPGGIYLESGNDDDKPRQYDEEYIYEIFADTLAPDKGIRIICHDTVKGEIIFDGTPQGFLNKLQEPQSDE